MAAAASATLDVAGILRKLQLVGFCEGFSPSSAGGDKPSALFDLIISAFLQEVYEKGKIRPFPAFLGDGRRIDLLQLYTAVRSRGGYDAVAVARGEWAAVAMELGLGPGVGSSLKLVYAKYLAAVDQWFFRVLDPKSNDNSDSKSLVVSATESDEWMKGGKGKTKPAVAPAPNGQTICSTESVLGENSNAGVVVTPSLVGSKRKREVLVGMVNWVRELAKSPHEVAADTESHQTDEENSELDPDVDFLPLALSVREMTFLKRTRGSGTFSTGLIGWKLSPSSGFSAQGTILSENCSGTLISEFDRENSPSRLETSHQPNGVAHDSQLEVEGRSNGDRQYQKISSKTFGTSVNWLSKKRCMHIPVGRQFQAEVPAFRSKQLLQSSDPDTLRWLGTTIWSPESHTNNSAADVSVGEGRASMCECHIPGSVDCVRFHVVEQRLQLKRGIGSAFYAWGFHHMGEEVALSWTEDEEKKFREIVRKNPPSLDKNYWNQLYMHFPSKDKRKLISYYFNVFLLGRRAYQNRVTPDDIDSDDDDIDSGFLSNRFGHRALQYQDIKHVTVTSCAQNSQCMELGEKSQVQAPTNSTVIQFHPSAHASGKSTVTSCAQNSQCMELCE